MVNDRWEEAEVPGHAGYVVTRDRFSAGQVSILRGGEVVAAGVAHSDSLAHAQEAAARWLDGPPPEPKPVLTVSDVARRGKVTTSISAADALKAGLVTQAFVDLVGPDTMVKVSGG